MKQIPGMLMYPCSLNEEDHNKMWQNSEFFTDKEFMFEYQKHQIAMEHIVECAKIYITKYWKEVKDWSDIEVEIIDGSTGEKTEYFKYTGDRKKDTRSKSRVMKELWDKCDEMDKQRHNPMLSVDNVVLDTTDGDFSIIVNGGKEHWWIQNEAIIIIANYIEEHLKNE